MSNNPDKGKINTIQRPSDERLKQVQESTKNEGLKANINEKLKTVNKPFSK